MSLVTTVKPPLRRDYRILFTGSRRMTDPEPIEQAVRALARAIPEMAAYERVVIVHGAGPGDRETGAPGCDALVDALFRREFDAGVEGSPFVLEPHPPLEAKFGRWPAAGPRRNTFMVGLGAHWCLAFPCRRSKGTTDCATKAWKAGIPTWIRLQKIP